MGRLSETDNQGASADWDTVGLSQNKNKINVLKLRGGNTYRVRLFHKPMPVLRYYVNGRSAICGDPKRCPIAIKHPTITPKSNYSIIVIDRLDQMVKVLEAPAGVFKGFRKFYDAYKVDPGGSDAVDFQIKVTGYGLNIRYEVTYSSQKTPFTDEEKQNLRAAYEQGYRLDELFKPTPVDQIESILFPNREVDETKTANRNSNG